MTNPSLVPVAIGTATSLVGLQSNRPYLDRYHCAAALLQLLRCSVFEAVELSAAWPVVAENLARLRRIIETSVGPPAR